MVTTIPNKVVNKAKKKAKNWGESAYIVEMDHQEDRAIYVVKEDYINSGEFDAFCGEVLAIVEKDGEVEFQSDLLTLSEKLYNQIITTPEGSKNDR